MSDEIIDEEMKKKLETATEIVNNVSDKLKEKTDEAIKENEEDEKEFTKKQKQHQRDILKLFYFVYGFAYICLIAKFISFLCFGISIDIALDRLALTLNVAIVFIGSAEGIKSITTSLSEGIGESTQVPAYKLKYLFGYLVAFAIITATAVTFEFIIKFKMHKDPTLVFDGYNANDFLNGLLSNTLAYLVARFGNKIAEGIDLSSLTFFKKK